ncbi:MAG: HDOD domain-containing protein [Terracidiphilus sp.]
MPSVAQVDPALKPAAQNPSDSSGVARFVARQPILDARTAVHGYELLFRRGREQAFAGDGILATRIMIDNAVIYGLDRLTGYLPAFVNCTTESLTEELVHALPPSISVLELLEDIEPGPAVVDACRKLKAMGFRLALDDFSWRPGIEPLVELADYIKVDFKLLDADARGDLLRRLSGRAVPLCLIAEKVETQEDFRRACDEGFRLFQGFFFCRPELMEKRKVPANRLSQFEILDCLQRDEHDLGRLGELVRRDTSLTFRLLRMVNSPVCAVRQEISSIEMALLVVGEEAFRRVVALAIATDLNAGQPLEILRMALVRARFCELVAPSCGQDASEQYMAGMLSMFPAMLRIPMAELAASLPLRTELRRALLGEQVPERTPLAWLEAIENGDWTAAERLLVAFQLDSALLARSYPQAVEWAETVLHADTAA